MLQVIFRILKCQARSLYFRSLESLVMLIATNLFTCKLYKFEFLMTAKFLFVLELSFVICIPL